MKSMTGTLTPEQMAQLILQQQALSSALREGGQSPIGGGGGGQVRAVSANPDTSDAAKALGNALGQGAGALYNNFSTAGQYGTNPFSQQTGMIAAQNAGF